MPAVQSTLPTQEALDAVKQQVLTLQAQLDRSEASAQTREVSMLLAAEHGLQLL